MSFRVSLALSCMLIIFAASASIRDSLAAQSNARVRVTISLPKQSIVYCYGQLRKAQGLVQATEIPACQPYLTQRPASSQDGSSGPPEGPSSVRIPGTRIMVEGTEILQFTAP